jgi:hypothetical protein
MAKHKAKQKKLELKQRIVAAMGKRAIGKRIGR